MLRRLRWDALLRSEWLQLAALLLVGGTLRLLAAGPWLPWNLRDENEVVEGALVALGTGKHYFYKYGGLNMYLLAGVYRVQAFVSGQSVEEFASQIFSDPTPFYLTARYTEEIALSLCTLATFVVLRRHFGRRSALWAALFQTLPVIERVTSFTVRTDALLAVCQTLTVLATFDAWRTGRLRSIALAGLFAGLSIGSKPIAGAIVMPVVAAAPILYAFSASSNRRQLLTRLFGLRCLSHLLLALCIAGVVAAVANPPSLTDTSKWIEAQEAAIELHSSWKAPPGYRIDRLSRPLGWPVLVLLLSGLAFCVAFPDPRARFLAAFPVLYLGLLATKPAMLYYYLPAVPLLAACAGIMISRVQQLVTRVTPRRLLGLGVALIAIFSIGYKTQVQLRTALGPFAERDPRRQATQWIEQTLKPKTKLLYFGQAINGPDLVFDNVKADGRFHQYFWYGRGRAKWWKTLHQKAHARERRMRPSFKIEHIDRMPGGKIPEPLKTRIKKLPEYAKRKKHQYVVLAWNLYNAKPSYPWLKRLTHLRTFATEGCNSVVAVYKVK